MPAADIAGELRAIVGAANIAESSEVEERYRTDLLRKSRTSPGVVVRPKSTAEVSSVMRVACAAGVSVTALGGGTGLVGGAIADNGGILISFERMREILEIDEVSMTVTAEAGATIQSLQTAVESRDFLLPLDLGSRGTATVGGTIATNAGGTRVLRYGMMRDMVLGLEAVLADGSVVSSLGKSLKDNAGYNWKQLIIGSEGTLGLVTKAVLRLRIAPRSVQTALLAMPSLEAAAKVLRVLQGRLAGRLSSYELMWRNFYEFVTDAQLDKRPPPLPTGSGMYVLVEAQGDAPDDDSAHFSGLLEGLLNDSLIENAVVAQTTRQGNELWTLRDDLIDVMARIKPRYAFDVSMALSDMSRFVADTEERIARDLPNAILMFYGHGGDGNLHVAVGPRGDLANAEARAAAAVYEAVRGVGGSISAEHGIGRYKRPYLAMTRSAAEIDLMRLIKGALDPRNILNPGKVLPDV
ncbi:MAG: FAD-binding oxidoreductase [Pseudomonadota bacterium]|nr:FAD-binding oxidoreductase [Pseudomonadota bacterium]